MSFSTIKFLGASVSNASSSIAWGLGQPSQLSVTLVEDTRDGDAFAATDDDIGTPVTFSAGSMSFRGLLQSFKKNTSVQGEIYEALVVDPRQILENAQVITSGFSGSTENLKNLYNVYGYWENIGGFGASLWNDAGIPWFRVRDALLALINGGVQTSFGGPLVYRGFAYSIDLSEIPTPALEYRVQSGYISLLELIGQMCEDGGCDFYITLDSFTVRVKTISRITAPPLGTITTFVEANEGNNLTRSEVGLELRNENNSTFLVGGEQTILHLTSGVRSFWGYDFDGAPILGTPGAIVVVDGTGVDDIVAVEPSDFMSLNASPVADVLGSTSYDCSTFEMRLALADQGEWSDYIKAYKPSLASLVGAVTSMRVSNLKRRLEQGLQNNQIIVPGDVIDTAAVNMMSAIEEDSSNNTVRLHSFVREYAQQFMGKKYAVPIPFVSRKVDTDTGITTYSHEPSDGGYLPEGSDPLGLDEINEDVFKTPDGRFTPFAVFNYLGSGFDLSRTSPDDVVLQQAVGSGFDIRFDMYMRAGVENQIIFAPNPYVIMDLPSPVSKIPEEIYGSQALLNAAINREEATNVLNNAAQVAQTVLSLAGALVPGNVGIVGPSVTCVVGTAPENNLPMIDNGLIAFGSVQHGIEPQIIDPTFAAIPLKSNVLTYGPWISLGVDGGKVRYEQDSSLVPWNYGGFTEMNLAALAKIQGSATNMQVGEQGTIEQAGLPIANLGATLAANGPNITDINIRYDAQGAITTYRFQTYSPRFGVFNKGQSERIRRVGTAQQQLRREIRAKVNENIAKVGVQSDAYGGLRKNLMRLLAQNTPHPTLLAQTLVTDSKLRVGVATMTPEEAAFGCGSGDQSSFLASAAMSLAGLIHPVSTQGSGYLMGRLAQGSGVFATDGSTYNPYKTIPSGQQLATDFLTVGTEFYDINFGKGTGIAPNQDVRFLAFNAPFILTGWGQTIDGGVVPTGVNRTTLKSDYRAASDLWATAPVDFQFDPYRGVWTMPRTYKGKLGSTISAGGTDILIVHSGIADSPTPLRITVKNYFSSPVSSGVKAIASFDVTENCYYIVAADC